MRIILRPVTINDGSLIVKWRNSPEILSHCMNQKPITLESNAIFFKNYVKSKKYIQYIVEKIDEFTNVLSYPIATVYLKDIDYFNHRCELCIFTSNDEEWNNKSQAIAIRKLLKEAFIDLKMHKVYSYVFYKFLNQAELLRESGFTIESIFKNEIKTSPDTYDDIVRFVIFFDDYERLLIKHD